MTMNYISVCGYLWSNEKGSRALKLQPNAGWGRRESSGASRPPMEVRIASGGRNSHEHSCKLELGHAGMHVCSCNGTLREVSIHGQSALYAPMQLLGYGAIVLTACVVLLVVLSGLYRPLEALWNSNRLLGGITIAVIATLAVWISRRMWPRSKLFRVAIVGIGAITAWIILGLLQGLMHTKHPTPTSLLDSSTAKLACGLGIRWNEVESGIQGTWIRRGTSNVFDATYSIVGVTAVNAVYVSGGKVHVERTSSSDGNRVVYDGTFGADGKTITGKYHTVGAGRLYDWGATVICDAASPKDARSCQSIHPMSPFSSLTL
jgi:hypothetical protein